MEDDGIIVNLVNQEFAGYREYVRMLKCSPFRPPAGLSPAFCFCDVCAPRIDESQVVHILGDGIVNLVGVDVTLYNVNFVVEEEAMLSFIAQSVKFDSTQVRTSSSLALLCRRLPTTGANREEDLSVMSRKVLGRERIVRMGPIERRADSNVF